MHVSIYIYIYVENIAGWGILLRHNDKSNNNKEIQVIIVLMLIFDSDSNSHNKRKNRVRGTNVKIESGGLWACTFSNVTIHECIQCSNVSWYLCLEHIG